MKFNKLILVGVICGILPSCGVLKGVGQMGSGMMKSVGRTAGMNVSNHEPAKTELEKQEEEASKIY